MAEVGLLDGRQAILWKLYIESALRGSGLGTAMLSLAESRLGADTDVLFTEFVTGNEGAERFYLAHGFHFDRVEPDQRDGIEATYTWLKKDLRLRSTSWTG